MKYLGRTLVAMTTAAGLAACSAGGDAPASAPPTVPPASASAPTPAPARSAAPRTTRGLVVPAPGQAPAQPLPITELNVTFHRGVERPLATTIWYPAGPGPYPLVLFSHGLTSEPGAYAALLTAWARAGFVVAAPRYPHTSYGVRDLNAADIVNQPADASYVIGQVLAKNTTAGDPLSGRIDATRIAAAGHSAGGITTIGMFTGNRDGRLIAGIVLSGRQLLSVPLSGAPAAMLFVHGKLDRTVPYAQALAAFRAVPWSRAMMSVTKGDHVAITKDYRPVITTTTDFLRWSLYGDAAARARLRRDATGDGVATWTDQL